MHDSTKARISGTHSHVFLGAGHERNERKTWAVIALCTVMMVAEIIGGTLFGSLALIADGLHMSTHAGAILIAALAYTYARRHAHDPRFGFGTGKLGDLAGFSSAIVLAVIALFIGIEAIARVLSPVPIHFTEAIPIAIVGLAVNLVSAWLLSDHEHGHGHGDAIHAPHHAEGPTTVKARGGPVEVAVFEDGVPPRFRLTFAGDRPAASAVSLQTLRRDGTSQTFSFVDRDRFLESREEIPEPHEFGVRLQLPGEEHALSFVEHHAHDHLAHGGAASAHRDHNIRSAYVHVTADAAVSVVTIVGLVLARTFGWMWMDPLAGIVGAAVIANWAYGLIRDTAGVLLDVVPDQRMQGQIRETIEGAGDQLVDLHLWRLGPGHLGVVLSVLSNESRTPEFFRAKLSPFKSLSHITVEVQARGSH
ncbi:MAG TPA: CDF family Co(II)/Ni(II) efflux transporter DmeF [Casimicrobiaceae bacterium]|jgi:cation diffusion facilitator family transporter|nr:CDF family Co(II)/Ni(II) efflux transporter DmeF [Casimicrobiaceae bacterium]